jgi:uncharacterized protein YycO
VIAPVVLSELAPYISRDGSVVAPGCYGVSHGVGIVGELVRHATDSWAGHCFLHLGNGQIVEGHTLVARVVSADSHPDAVWNIHESLSDDQRLAIIAKAQAMVGTPYDYASYIGFALELLKLRTEAQLDRVFQQDSWRVCSALVADCYRHAGIVIDTGAQAANLVSPDDLYRRIVSQS